MLSLNTLRCLLAPPLPRPLPPLPLPVMVINKSAISVEWMLDGWWGLQWYFTNLNICLLEKLSVHPHLDYPRLDYNVIWTNVIRPKPQIPSQAPHPSVLSHLRSSFYAVLWRPFTGEPLSSLPILWHCTMPQNWWHFREPSMSVAHLWWMDRQVITAPSFSTPLSPLPPTTHHKVLPPSAEMWLPAACEQSSNHFFGGKYHGGLGVCTALWHFLILKASSNGISLSRAWYCTLLSKGPRSQT